MLLILASLHIADLAFDVGCNVSDAPFIDCRNSHLTEIFSSFDVNQSIDSESLSLLETTENDLPKGPGTGHVSLPKSLANHMSKSDSWLSLLPFLVPLF